MSAVDVTAPAADPCARCGDRGPGWRWCALLPPALGGLEAVDEGDVTACALVQVARALVQQVAREHGGA